MPRAIYRGPGDSVELDGITVEKGKGIELTHEQIARIAASDPEAVVDVTRTKVDDDEARELQDRKREKRAEREAS